MSGPECSSFSTNGYGFSYAGQYAYQEDVSCPEAENQNQEGCVNMCTIEGGPFNGATAVPLEITDPHHPSYGRGEGSLMIQTGNYSGFVVRECAATEHCYSSAMPDSDYGFTHQDLHALGRRLGESVMLDQYRPGSTPILGVVANGTLSQTGENESGVRFWIMPTRANMAQIQGALEVYENSESGACEADFNEHSEEKCHAVQTTLRNALTAEGVVLAPRMPPEETNNDLWAGLGLTALGFLLSATFGSISRMVRTRSDFRVGRANQIHEAALARNPRPLGRFARLISRINARYEMLADDITRGTAERIQEISSKESGTSQQTRTQTPHTRTAQHPFTPDQPTNTNHHPPNTNRVRLNANSSQAQRGGFRLASPNGTTVAAAEEGIFTSEAETFGQTLTRIQTGLAGALNRGNRILHVALEYAGLTAPAVEGMVTLESVMSGSTVTAAESGATTIEATEAGTTVVEATEAAAAVTEIAPAAVEITALGLLGAATATLGLGALFCGDTPLQRPLVQATSEPEPTPDERRAQALEQARAERLARYQNLQLNLPSRRLPFELELSR